MMPGRIRRIVIVHLAVIGVLFLLQFVLPAYHHTNVARIMVLATFAMGYNVLFGYTGLMSLGHAFITCSLAPARRSRSVCSPVFRWPPCSA